MKYSGLASADERQILSWIDMTFGSKWSNADGPEPSEGSLLQM